MQMYGGRRTNSRSHAAKIRRWQHGGNDVAHSSTFVYYPDLDAGYVVFSNYEGVPGGIAGVVADSFLGPYMTAAPQRATAAGTAASTCLPQRCSVMPAITR